MGQGWSCRHSSARELSADTDRAASSVQPPPVQPPAEAHGEQQPHHLLEQQQEQQLLLAQQQGQQQQQQQQQQQLVYRHSLDVGTHALGAIPPCQELEALLHAARYVCRSPYAAIACTQLDGSCWMAHTSCSKRLSLAGAAVLCHDDQRALPWPQLLGAVAGSSVTCSEPGAILPEPWAQHFAWFMAAPLLTAQHAYLGMLIIMDTSPQRCEAGLCRLLANLAELAVRILERNVCLVHRLQAASLELPPELQQLWSAAAAIPPTVPAALGAAEPEVTADADAEDEMAATIAAARDVPLSAEISPAFAGPMLEPHLLSGPAAADTAGNAASSMACLQDATPAGQLSLQAPPGPPPPAARRRLVQHLKAALQHEQQQRLAGGHGAVQHGNSKRPASSPGMVGMQQPWGLDDQFSLPCTEAGPPATVRQRVHTLDLGFLGPHAVPGGPAAFLLGPPTHDAAAPAAPPAAAATPAAAAPRAAADCPRATLDCLGVPATGGAAGLQAAAGLPAGLLTGLRPMAAAEVPAGMPRPGQAGMHLESGMADLVAASSQQQAGRNPTPPAKDNALEPAAATAQVRNPDPSSFRYLVEAERQLLHTTLPAVHMGPAAPAEPAGNISTSRVRHHSQQQQQQQQQLLQHEREQLLQHQHHTAQQQVQQPVDCRANALVPPSSPLPTSTHDRGSRAHLGNTGSAASSINLGESTHLDPGNLDPWQGISISNLGNPSRFTPLELKPCITGLASSGHGRAGHGSPGPGCVASLQLPEWHSNHSFLRLPSDRADMCHSRRSSSRERSYSRTLWQLLMDEHNTNPNPSRTLARQLGPGFEGQQGATALPSSSFSFGLARASRELMRSWATVQHAQHLRQQQQQRQAVPRQETAEELLLLNAVRRQMQAVCGDVLTSCCLLVDTNQPGWPVVYCNDSWKLWSGISRKQTQGRPLQSLLAPARLGTAGLRWAQLQEQAADGGHFVICDVAAVQHPLAPCMGRTDHAPASAASGQRSPVDPLSGATSTMLPVQQDGGVEEALVQPSPARHTGAILSSSMRRKGQVQGPAQLQLLGEGNGEPDHLGAKPCTAQAGQARPLQAQEQQQRAAEHQQHTAMLVNARTKRPAYNSTPHDLDIVLRRPPAQGGRPSLDVTWAARPVLAVQLPSVAISADPGHAPAAQQQQQQHADELTTLWDRLEAAQCAASASTEGSSGQQLQQIHVNATHTCSHPSMQQAVTSPVKGDHVLGTGDGAILGELAARLRSGAGAADVADSGALPAQQPSSTSLHPATDPRTPAGLLEPAGLVPRHGVRWSATAVAAGAAAGAATRPAAGGARTQLRVLPELLQQQQQQQPQMPAASRCIGSSGLGSGARASGISSGAGPWDVGRRSSWLYGTGSGLHSAQHSGLCSGDALLSTYPASETATTEDLLEELTLKDEAGRAAKASHFVNEVRAHGIHPLRAPHVHGHHARAHAAATAPRHLQHTASCSYGMADAAGCRDHDGADGRSAARQYSPAVQPGSTSGLMSPMTSQTPRGPLQNPTAAPLQASPSSINALPEALVQGRSATRAYAKQFTQQPACSSHAGPGLHTSGPARTPSFVQEQQDSGQGSAAAGLPEAGVVTRAGLSAPSPGTISPKASPTRVAAGQTAGAAAGTAAAAPAAGAAAVQPGLPPTLNSTLAQGCLGTSFNLSFHPLALHRLDKQAPRVELPGHVHMSCAAHLAGLYVVHVHAMGVLPAPEEPLLPGAKVEHAANASPAVLAQFLWPGLQLGDMLGCGAYGAAFAGVWHGLEVVVKVHDVTVNNAQELANAQLEVELGQELGHRNLVQTLSHAAVQLPQPAPNLQQPFEAPSRAGNPAAPTAALGAPRPGQATPRASAVAKRTVDANPSDASCVAAPSDGNAACFALLGPQQQGAVTTESRTTAPPAATNAAVHTDSVPAPAAPHAASGPAHAAVTPPQTQQQQHGTSAASAQAREASTLQAMLQPSPGCFLLGAPAAALQLPDVMHSSHSGAGHGSLLLLSDDFAQQDAPGAVDGPHSLDLQLGYGVRGRRTLSGGSHALPPASSPLPGDLKEHAAIAPVQFAAGPDGQQQSSVCDAQPSVGTATCPGAVRYVPMHLLSGGHGDERTDLPGAHVENSAGQWSRAGLAAASPHATREGGPPATHLQHAAPAATSSADAAAASTASAAADAAGPAIADAQPQGSQWACPGVHPQEDGQLHVRASEAGSVDDAGEGRSSGCNSGSTRDSPAFPLHLRCMQLMELCNAGTLQQAIDNCLLHCLGAVRPPSQSHLQAAMPGQQRAQHGVPAADACISGPAGAASPAAASTAAASPAAAPAPQQDGPLPHLPKLLCLAHDICSALAHMHAHGVVHADLSANNVLLVKCPTRVQQTCYSLTLGEVGDELPPSSAPSFGAVGSAWRAAPGRAAAMPEASLPVHLAADMQMRLGPRPSNQPDDPWFIAKVSDLGKSRLVAPRAQLQVYAYATITHMAPEVLQHKTISHAGDVFSLGVILWQMYTGQRAWRGMSRQQVFDAVVSGGRLEWPRDTRPAALADLGRACCHAQPAARPTAQQVLQVLRELLHQQGCFLQEVQELQELQQLQALHTDTPGAAGPAG